MLNFSRLFNNENDESYLKNLDLDESDKQVLNDAKSLIRSTLKDELPGKLKDIAGDEAVSQPKFFTQGSWAYKTLNAPAKSPQQADLDDGCYLPLSYMQEIKKPSQATTIFFQAVEAVLGPLAIKNGWTLVTDKPTCTRLEINDNAHIDIPLYAIPDQQFKLMKEAREAKSLGMDALTARYQSWDDLPDDVVLLAHRKDDWISSDPRPIKDWFNEQCQLNGEQLRRVVRYLKGYRDFQWQEGGPSSILLMAATVPIFSQHPRRDDMALLEVARQLPDILRGGVCNPTNEAEILTDRLSTEALEEAALAYERLAQLLASCMQATDAPSVCVWLRKNFGNRIPELTELITSTTATETIKEVAPLYTASPLVGRTEAGLPTKKEI